jgi:hypothetical protein
MADIEIGSLSDRLTDEEVTEVTRALLKAGAPKLPKADETLAFTVAKGVDDHVVTEFLDRLEASDIGCDIYVPVEFDGTVKAAEVRVGSLHALLDVLEELKEDLMVEEEEEEQEEASDDDDEDYEEDDEEEEDEEDTALALADKRLRRIWKLFYEGAREAIDRHLPMFVTSG